MKKKLKFKLIALDTNIFIYFFENDVNFGDKARLIFEKLAENKLKAVTSITSLAELLASPKLDERAAKATKKLFLSVPNLEVYSMDEAIAIKSAEIRRKYNFRLLDAIQLATSKSSKAEAFITNDHRLKKFKEEPVVLLADLKT